MPDATQNTGTTLKKKPHPNRANALRVKKCVTIAIGYVKKFRKPTKETAVVLNELESALNAIDNVLVTCGDVEAYQ